MKQCNYDVIFPDGEIRCMVYSYSKRPDGKWWAHFPECSEEKCPLKHPELLEGAIFDEEEFYKTWMKGKKKERFGRIETLD